MVQTQAPPSYEFDFNEASPSKPCRPAPSVLGVVEGVPFQHPVKPPRSGSSIATSLDDYEYPVKPGKVDSFRGHEAPEATGTVGAAGGGASGKESDGTVDDSSELMSD